MAHFLKTLKLRLFTFFKIPIINFCTPTVMHIDDVRCEMKIPLNYRTKNHVRSMYFGALAVGADVCIGSLALHHIQKQVKKPVLIFKDFTIDFKKKAMSDVHFICDEGAKVEALVKKAAETGERQSEAIKGYAVTPKLSQEPIAHFTLTLSLK